MGFIVDRENGIETVGEMVKSLQRFPDDMPISSMCCDQMEVYKVTPQAGETVDDPRGQICIEADD
jgi:hypothetical protein